MFNKLIVSVFTASTLFISVTAIAATSKGREESSAAVVGRWVIGSMSGVTFYNPSSGHWAAPTGAGQFYEFSADGHYVEGLVLQSSFYGCTSTGFVYRTGTWTVEGSTIHLSPTSGRAKGEDSCNSSGNYEKAARLNKETLSFAFKPDEYSKKLELCVATNKGDVCYRREPAAK